MQVRRLIKRKWRLNNRDKIKNFPSNSKENHRKQAKNYRLKIRLKVIQLLGGKCANPYNLNHGDFENDIHCLQVDHINGGGRKDRAERSGAGFYAHLEKLGFPKEGYRLLCMNCNFSIGIYGYCPHQKPTESFPLP